VVHAPHRWYALEEEIHGVNQLRIVGGVSNCCLQHGLNFYDGVTNRKVVESTNNNTSTNANSMNENDDVTIIPNSSVSTDRHPSKAITSNKVMDLVGKTDYRISTDPVNDDRDHYAGNSTSNINLKQSLGIPMHPVSSVEVAELTKIVENAHRYLQIAFAEELYLYSKANGISFSELRESLNTKWNVEILEPRDGIGGHCLPKDTKMFINSSNTIKSKILQAAMEIDEDYREYIQSREKSGSNGSVAIKNKSNTEAEAEQILYSKKIK
jgi:UDP-N-acetyl-D-mannosaminuronate dehydrogenase